MATVANSFLIGSSSFLQVTRTNIKSQTSSKFDQIPPWTAHTINKIYVGVVNQFSQICNRVTALD